MSSKQARQLATFHPIEIGGKEDAVLQRDVSRASQVERARVEIGAAFRFAARVDRVGWVNELEDPGRVGGIG